MDEIDVINQIQRLVHQKHLDEHHNLDHYIHAQLKSAGIKSLPELSILECHVLACIGDAHISNAITISKKMGVTRGGISKITTRLIAKGLIISNQIEGNKREIFYQLTPLGTKIYEIHDRLHKEINDKFINLLSKYSKDDQKVISQFLNDLLNSI